MFCIPFLTLWSMWVYQNSLGYVYSLIIRCMREGERERERDVCCASEMRPSNQPDANIKVKLTIGILWNQWGRDDVNFKCEATFAFDLDAKWSYRKSCLSSAADSFVFPWYREKHHRNTESLELDTYGINERFSFNLFVFVFISLPLR